jgi:hypothetical protein
MNWTAISTITEVIGVIVVVVSLGYVAAQIRQSTNAILGHSRQILLDADLGLISDYIDTAIDPHLIGDDVELSPEDERRFVWLLIKAIRIREFAWHQYNSGNLDEESLQSYMAPVAGMFASERAKAVLKFYTGDQEFMQYFLDWLGAAQQSSRDL